MGSLVLVTGGAGYLGSIVAEELLARGARVRVLDALLHGNRTSVDSLLERPEYSFVHGDVRDDDARRRALDDVDAVVHLAAIVGDPACARQPDLAREVNFDASRAMFEDARAADIDRFVFASTCSNYGKVPGESVASEEFPLNPVSLYAETKVRAELEVLAHANGGVAATCVRLATVFGVSPRMRFDLTVNEFTRDVFLKRELVVYGEQFWRPYVHVRDAARAIRIVLESPRTLVAGEVFNVGSTTENYRKLDLVEILEGRFPDARVEFVHRDEDPRDYRVSFEKVRDGLGFEVERPVPSGIDEVSDLLRGGTIENPYDERYRN